MNRIKALSKNLGWKIQTKNSIIEAVNNSFEIIFPLALEEFCIYSPVISNRPDATNDS